MPWTLALSAILNDVMFLPQSKDWEHSVSVFLEFFIFYSPSHFVGTFSSCRSQLRCQLLKEVFSWSPSQAQGKSSPLDPFLEHSVASAETFIIIIICVLINPSTHVLSVSPLQPKFIGGHFFCHWINNTNKMPGSNQVLNKHFWMHESRFRCTVYITLPERLRCDVYQ